MRIVLFCENLYSLSILAPLDKEAQRQGGNTILWYMHKPNIPLEEIPQEVNWTYSIQEVYDFSPEAIFVPGNIVPYYLPGVKIQIFHGYAAEKKGHYVMRKYFDLYLTQGPLYTAGFNALAAKHGNFEVKETGWSKQDLFVEHRTTFDTFKLELLERYEKRQIVLYAPTFSPKLTSLTSIKEKLVELIHKHDDLLLVIKLHPLTAEELVEEYKALAASHSDRVIFVAQGDGLLRYELISDIMISDTSSVVYEFILLQKPVITLNSIAQTIYWHNISMVDELIPTFEKISNSAEHLEERYQEAQALLDPYVDGLSSRRMIEAAADYIARNGVPRYRKVNLWRRYTSIKKFGRVVG
ncbi:MAG: CDP-glycerol glycerophosphotransferase family protein [Rikenellaceae bacterium]